MNKNSFKIILVFSLFLLLFSFRGYAVDDSVGFGFDVTLKINIPINLYLNDTEGNRTYQLYDIANFTAKFNHYNETIYLDSDYPGWVLQNDTNSTIYNLTNLSSTGLYYLTTYWNTTSENYMDSVQTYFFDVTPYWINNLTSVASGSTYVLGQDYQFNITWIGDISEVRFEADFNGTIINYIDITNSSNVYWINFTDLPAGNYKYRWYANDTNNNSVSTPQFDYVISQIPLTLTLSITGNLWTVETGTTVAVTCTADPSVNLTLSMTNPIQSETSLSPVSIQSILSEIEKVSTFTCRPINTNYSGYITQPLTFQATTTTGGGTGGTGGAGDYVAGIFTIDKLVSSISVNAGESKSITFDLKNTLNNDLYNITITLTGINSGWYTIPKIDKVSHGTSKSVTIRFNIPEDAEVKNYSVAIKARGEKPLGGTVTTASKSLKLTVNPKVEEEIEEAVTAPENVTAAEEAPTGFLPLLLPLLSEYSSYLIILVAAIAAILIFVKRHLITYTLMKKSGRKVPKKLKDKATKAVGIPFLKDFSYKLPTGLKKSKKSKDLEKPEEKEEELDREIKKDIKELQNILEAEKRIKKRRK